MSTFDPFNEPNPANSPIEKLKIARRAPAPSDFSRYLRAEGVDPDLATKLGQAFSRWEHDQHYKNVQFLTDLEAHFNIHTHSGVGSQEYPPPPEIDWAFEWWASDPNIVWPADGEIIVEWPDMAGVNPWNGGTTMTYHVGSTYWDGPFVKRSQNGSMRVEAATVVGAEVTQPFTFVQVYAKPVFLVSGDNYQLFTQPGQVITSVADTDLLGRAGSTLQGFHSIDAEIPHLSIWEFNGTSSAIEHDGEILATGDMGTLSVLVPHTLTNQFEIGMGLSSHELEMGYLAVKDGLLTSTEKVNLLSWASGLYGVVPA